MKYEDHNPAIKFLFISDTHFGVHYAIRPRNKLKYQYGNRFFNKVDDIFHQTIQQGDIDFILHGGDFFNRSKPHPEVIKKSTSMLLWAAKFVPIYLIPGNHERSKLPLGLLRYYDNIHVFSSPCSYIFEKDNIRIKITGFPYIRHNAGNKAKSVINTAWNNELNKKIDRTHYNILLMHQLIQGSRIEHYTFNKGHNVIKIGDIPQKFHLIATGHVHRYQILYAKNHRTLSTHTQQQIIHDLTNQKWRFASPRMNKKDDYPTPVICYAGSCERISMMERNEDKGYVLGTLTTNNSDRIQLSGAHFEFVPTPSTEMKYIKWNFSCKSIEQLIKEVETLVQDMNRKVIGSSLAGLIHILVQQPVGIPSARFTQLIEYARTKNVLLTVRWKNFPK